ncbi:ASN_HP2_G0016160.mRNA.1.CDS.1 [Saccharomyces cerevisiae]|nr:ASN_HP2_G0016160.mRNA.1.CDS.1 [Saccharomyces cerevisiae]CAI6526517.1 ASN_HP2_G0016160.mRNA.1.CDS.1 [Saccharomyces cerevisiae]CAI6560239.1 ASN_HP1_G0015940.mRNA.1.CDS.1 [Saccharomyces cerevisiae]
MTLGHESNGAVLEIELNIPFAASLTVTAPFVKSSWLTSTAFTDYFYSEFLARVLCRCHYLSLSM